MADIGYFPAFSFDFVSALLINLLLADLLGIRGTPLHLHRSSE